jgi:hypothetical protein
MSNKRERKDKQCIGLPIRMDQVVRNVAALAAEFRQKARSTGNADCRSEFDAGRAFVYEQCARQVEGLEGYVLVPLEPTREMITAGAEMIFGEQLREQDDRVKLAACNETIDVYKAMLAAASIAKED